MILPPAATERPCRHRTTSKWEFSAAWEKGTGWGKGCWTLEMTTEGENERDGCVRQSPDQPLCQPGNGRPVGTATQVQYLAPAVGRPGRGPAGTGSAERRWRDSPYHSGPAGGNAPTSTTSTLPKPRSTNAVFATMSWPTSTPMATSAREPATSSTWGRPAAT